MSIGTAVQQTQNTPTNMVSQYRGDFALVLPSHIKPETWVRVAQGALKKGERGANGLTKLEEAATNNPGAFMQALLEAARLGLEPGTEQFYLTPRKQKGRLEILGITGYQGEIELMYRAGAINSVTAEVVREGDVFDYQPGRDERPRHIIDWDKNRGALRLVYAFASMKTGGTSKVVVMNREAIGKVKASSQGASSEYSPWVKHEEAMWLKSAVHQLAKWVPTSPEYIREQIRAARDVASEPTPTPPPAGVNPDTGEINEDIIEEEN